jgi:hypothetical protein
MIVHVDNAVSHNSRITRNVVGHSRLKGPITRGAKGLHCSPIVPLLEASLRIVDSRPSVILSTMIEQISEARHAAEREVFRYPCQTNTNRITINRRIPIR